MKKEISILGLGSMGTAIALNLKKKYKIFGYDPIVGRCFSAFFGFLSIFSVGIFVSPYLFL